MEGEGKVHTVIKRKQSEQVVKDREGKVRGLEKIMRRGFIYRKKGNFREEIVWNERCILTLGKVERARC